LLYIAFCVFVDKKEIFRNYIRQKQVHSNQSLQYQRNHTLPFQEYRVIKCGALGDLGA